jgi:conjugative relaxase-like TrwC/TraI family protein
MWPKKMSGRDRGEYFLSLTEYYAGGGRIEPDGVWLGEGAKALGLTGTVTRAELRQLLSGFSPKGNPLVQNAGREPTVRYEVKVRREWDSGRTH